MGAEYVRQLHAIPCRAGCCVPIRATLPDKQLPSGYRAVADGHHIGSDLVPCLRMKVGIGP